MILHSQCADGEDGHGITLTAVDTGSEAWPGLESGVGQG